MFIYASLALGRVSNKRLERIVIDSKFLLGIGGILIVLGSVSASVGIFSAFGVKTSLIIAEVIPFLVLAIGVDNIFIIVYAFQEIERRHQRSAIEHKVAATMASVGPSILISSLSQTIAFGLGGAVKMPAISTFAGYASVAILADFLFQITCFVSLLTLDARRNAV
jgi:Niemann-Pick C1 protein